MLAWVGADHIPPNSMLPPPGPEQPRYLTRDALHPTYGPLRFTFRCMLAKHYKSSHWYWLPCRAEQLDANALKPGYWLERTNAATDSRGVPVKGELEG